MIFNCIINITVENVDGEEWQYGLLQRGFV